MYYFVFFNDLKFFSPSVLFAVLTLVYLELSMRVVSAPICSYGQAGCHVPSLADLFERVIQQSSRMHSVSSDLHSEFVSYFLSALTLIIYHHPSTFRPPFFHHQSASLESAIFRAPLI